MKGPLKNRWWLNKPFPQVDFPAVTVCNLNRVNCHNAIAAMYIMKTQLGQTSNQQAKVRSILSLSLSQILSVIIIISSNSVSVNTLCSCLRRSWPRVSYWWTSSCLRTSPTVSPPSAASSIPPWAPPGSQEWPLNCSCSFRMAVMSVSLREEAKNITFRRIPAFDWFFSFF